MEFIIDSCVRGHHVSKEFWTPELGKELSCQCEEGNLNDVYAVAAKTDANIVIGHLPKKISAACSLFLSHSGMIACEVTGSRQAPADLPQGGLNQGPSCIEVCGGTHMDKIKKLLTPPSSLSQPKLHTCNRAECSLASQTEAECGFICHMTSVVSMSCN